MSKLKTWSLLVFIAAAVLVFIYSNDRMYSTYNKDLLMRYLVKKEVSNELSNTKGKVHDVVNEHDLTNAVVDKIMQEYNENVVVENRLYRKLGASNYTTYPSTGIAVSVPVIVQSAIEKVVQEKKESCDCSASEPVVGDASQVMTKIPMVDVKTIAASGSLNQSNASANERLGNWSK